jgi:hypothetical protein
MLIPPFCLSSFMSRDLSEFTFHKVGNECRMKTVTNFVREGEVRGVVNRRHNVMLFVLHGIDRVCDQDLRRLAGVTLASSISLKRAPLGTTVNPSLPTSVCIYGMAPLVCG